MAEDDDAGEQEVAEGEQESKLEDGGSVEYEGSSSTYTLTRHGGVYMCTCPAWKNQGAPVDSRTCKHLRAYLGTDNETSRVGAAAPQRSSATVKKDKAAAEGKAPPVLLAHKWETDHDPTGSWRSSSASRRSGARA